MPKYRIDHAAFRRIADVVYGIRGPITLKRVAPDRMPKHDAGTGTPSSSDHAQCHTWILSRGRAWYVFHEVYLRTNLGPFTASRALAHELEHAWQAEWVIATTESPWLLEPVLEYLENPGTPYWQRESERVARRAGSEHGELIRRRCFQ